MAESFFRIARPPHHGLVRNSLRAWFCFDWFRPPYWGDQAREVDDGGRGAAWFIESEYGHWVLRHFRRGGLPGRVVRSLYLYLGHARVRSVQELRLLRDLRSRGLPVPEPIAAGYTRTFGLFCRAAIIVGRIRGSVPLASYWRDEDAPVWYRAGRCVRRFHDHGVYHADLNCSNILVTDQSIHLIDFDRCSLCPDSGPEAGWKRSNLRRLERSFGKMLANVDAASRERLWARFIAGYHGE
ncbi:3-deoxy-D-manno-octulosonic acid kinase [Tamilnaduibacter salinus]|uniref:3-deoxy-D-manno-octulosonic acid kinase n=1 Tax=Tamilnaduibacter salinus TaxID=1484056 RepID=A0A2A2I4C2_9GAMM|nr:3-deoxy-D-manno-octulosonic acid kinase [Tamilnaduibacter salinus]PAV25883.1 3-deoxy-D-manno-octulosonic acid kinase [Tamilnaduibacter salinus]PVY70337.1 3-deoxy-D-manno-octulosonic acid kinase [Tamilnaduibacter salinus]